MNRTETVLREGGFWDWPVTVDRKNRAVKGLHWGGRMFANWIDAGFYGECDETGMLIKPREPRLESGHWCQDQYGVEWWITDTPDWDKAWFKTQGVKPPKHFGDKRFCYWKDFGDGLSRLDYHAPTRWERWRAIITFTSLPGDPDF